MKLPANLFTAACEVRPADGLDPNTADFCTAAVYTGACLFNRRSRGRSLANAQETSYEARVLIQDTAEALAVLGNCADGYCTITQPGTAPILMRITGVRYDSLPGASLQRICLNVTEAAG